MAPLLAFLTLCLTFAVVEAEVQSVHHVYRFDRGDLHIDRNSNEIKMNDHLRTWEAGRPEIPYVVVPLLLPQGARVSQVTALATGERIVARDLPLRQATSRFADSGEEMLPRVSKWLGKTSSSSMYPPVRAEFAGSGYLHGYQIVSVRVYPLRFDSVSRDVYAANQLDLTVKYDLDGAMPLHRERFADNIETSARDMVKRLVANPEFMASYDRRMGEWVAVGEHGFRPTNAPSLEGSPVDYVIITNAAMESTFQTLADWKTRRGIPTVVRSVEWIVANYRNGSDLQETVRTFIQDAYAKWGVEYVLLGGDTDIIPARFAASTFFSLEPEIPTDMYYACLDGNWNADGDAEWGEAIVDSFNLVDNTDMYAEVFASRLPTSDATEAAAIISKIMEYENPVVTDYQDEVLLLAEVLFPVDWGTGQTITMDGSSFSENLASVLPACATTTKLYQNFASYPGALELNLANTIAALNDGHGFVNHIGHGFRYNMSVGDRSLVNDDATALTNGSQRFVLYFLNCTAMAFDFPSLAEAYMKAAGGAVAVLGSSRAAFPLPSSQYNQQFFVALHQDSIVNVGRTFVESRLLFTPNAFTSSADNYTHFLYNMLGDPEMIIHTCTLGSTVATHPTTVDVGSNNVALHVTVGGVSQQGARVCLQKGNEEYVLGLTDVNGDVALTFRAETSGTIQVTVSGQNMTTYLGTMSVNAAVGPYVHVTDVSIDDPDAILTVGNNDTVLDAGETFYMNVTLRNDGATGGIGITGVLRCNSIWASVLDSVYTLGNVGAATTATTLTELRISVSSSTPDGTVVPFEFVTTDGISVWTDVINKVVHAPKLEYVFLDVNDPPPGGNGDGIVQAGETVFLLPTFKNYGTGAANGLEVILITVDPDLTLIDGRVNILTIGSLQEVIAPQELQVTEATVAEENVMLMVLTDRYSRIQTFKVSLRPPAKPATPVLDASDAGAVVATWTPSVDVDLAGYHLYRSQSSLGPFNRVTQDRTDAIAYYRDIGLAASTKYYYFVTAVDSAGNESIGSDTAGINTVPGQLNGFPIIMGAVSSCPVAVGDITGNGVSEIIAGNNHLYAWDANGVELLDDDQDPQTWGVFVAEMAVVTSAVSLAELDPTSPGFEVFATVWDDQNKAFIIRSDGSFLPGWPQNPDTTTAQLGYWGAPGTADVDGDGIAEVFAAGKNGNLYAWHADGTPLGATSAWKANVGTWSRCSPTFANLDQDPYPEIIYGAPTGTLYVWNADGSDFPNFPQSPGTLALSSTAVGDVNNDGILDIVFITEGGAINVYDSSTGTQLPGWPVNLSISSSAVSPSPALADFNFDGFLEIVVAINALPVTNSNVSVYDYQGVIRPGWPKATEIHSSESSPIVADFTGNGVPNIIFGNEGGKIFGWDKDGNEISGFPLSTGDFIRSTPTAADVDGDGDIELVLMGWDQNLHVWDFTIPYNRAAAQWPTIKHDAQRSGLFDHRVNVPTDVGDTDDTEGNRIPKQPVLSQNIPNPFNPTTRISYGVPELRGASQTAGIAVRLDIFDVRGRHVRRLVQGSQAPGTYNALWDGRNDSGGTVHSGVFFYRLQVGDVHLTRKMMLLK